MEGAGAYHGVQQLLPKPLLGHEVQPAKSRARKIALSVCKPLIWGACLLEAEQRIHIAVELKNHGFQFRAQFISAPCTPVHFDEFLAVVIDQTGPGSVSEFAFLQQPDGVVGISCFQKTINAELPNIGESDILVQKGIALRF